MHFQYGKFSFFFHSLLYIIRLLIICINLNERYDGHSAYKCVLGATTQHIQTNSKQATKNLVSVSIKLNYSKWIPVH